MKRMHQTTAAAVFAALGLASSAALAAPCAGFADVDTSNQFCANIEWIKNRAVTQGCATGLYCPVDFVTREQMAAFMNRLGNALTPQTLTNTDAFDSYDLDLAESNVNAHLCKVGPIAAADYPRRALIYAQFSGYGAGPFQMFGTTTASVNGGAFQRNAPGGIGMRAQAGTAGWTNVTQTAAVDMAAGSTYTFAFFVQRAVEEAPNGNDIVSPSAGLGGGRCNMTVQVQSRTGTSSPFDAAAAGPLDNQ